ncbi:hypothetical protein HanPSC8_Chr10g0426471 [Helianthus annuus]|nr:hypothetical protein HanPSC8_Chr10g0426471 [Helianthus annuus]
MDRQGPFSVSVFDIPGTFTVSSLSLATVISMDGTPAILSIWYLRNVRSNVTEIGKENINREEILTYIDVIG